EGSGIDLEIAGMDDHTEGCSNGERYAIHHGMRHMDELHFEWSGLDNLAGVNCPELRLYGELMLIQAPLHQGQRERSAIDGHVEFGQEVRDGADVVLVAVRQKQRSDVFAVLNEIGEIRR